MSTLLKKILGLTLLLISLNLSAQNVPMDYSYCGYHRSEKPIPNAEVVIKLPCIKGDSYYLIQSAIDYVSSLTPDKETGMRGVVLLPKGLYEISRPLRISASGVVLRGADRNETIIRKTGWDRGAAIYIEGVDDRQYGEPIDINDELIKAGSIKLPLRGKDLKQGDEIVIVRPSTKEWIESLNCQSFGGGKELGFWGWHPGEIDIRWNRQILSISADSIELDAPLTTAIEKRWGGAKMIKYTWNGRVCESGVEQLTVESDYDRSLPMDEDHCWDGIYIANARNCWVRLVNFRHFAGSAVVVKESSEQVTVEDCKSYEPVSEIGGMRRRTFYTLGQKTLFQRCYSEHGIHDFAVGICAAGPNAFVQCDSKESFGFSGPVSSWAAGVLFDCVNIDGHDIMFTNLGLERQGAGWNTANSTLWQCTAAGIYCCNPDENGKNIAHGCWAQCHGDSEYTMVNEHVKPWSLYQQQLAKRLNKNVDEQCRVMVRNTGATSSPTIEQAMQMAQEALAPRQTLEQWIDAAPSIESVDSKNIKDFDDYKKYLASKFKKEARSFVYGINEGKLTNQNALAVGGRINTPWWNGRLRPSEMAKAKPAITRFVPDNEGTGLTDRIDSVIAYMKKNGLIVFNQNYGLWYDRRRDDHERVRRKDGDVWAPFYEQPFARSGQGKAWDGLSKYDLTKPNKWYYGRIKEFADKGKAEGIWVINQHYFQHNILEAGAHWVDCPWRTANNINNTPFLEPVPFSGDKRIFTAHQFYDISNERLKELHRGYIRMTLDQLWTEGNIIHSIGEEFTGPLHFVQFWLDCISEWEKEKGRQVFVSLAVNKDVQDAILADPVRSKAVDIICIEQWFYHNKGLYAPEGGVNMAPRQYMRKIKYGSPRFEDVYKSVSEYTTKHPDKAVVYYAQKYPENAWAVLMAGGSCPGVSMANNDLKLAIPSMKPQKTVSSKSYMLSDENNILIYKTDDSSWQMPAERKGTYVIYKVNAKTGETKKTGKLKSGGSLSGNGIYWLRKN
ncbi:MAG: pectate lyase [Prevotella sp.]|nr:pectate lyase [Prevotella sp.]